MRIALLLAVLMLCVCHGYAQRNNLKPYDFEPLTSLPWEGTGKELPLLKVLEKIYLEPDCGIRYPVLEAYLYLVPIEDLGKAFDICVALEGTQTPDNLVTLVLRIWAERDPANCWTKTQSLFHLVGIEDGWLTFDSWAGRPKIAVQDLVAIRSSRFWLGRSSMASFPDGVDRSHLSESKKSFLLRAFADKFIDTFHARPGGLAVPDYPTLEASSVLLHAFDETPGELSRVSSPAHRVVLEVQARRWLTAHPEDAVRIIADGIGKSHSVPADLPEDSMWPSEDWLLLWSRLDQRAMVTWIHSIEHRNSDLALAAKGILMSRVDAATRNRWIDEAKACRDDPGLFGHLLSCWAPWDPSAALASAVETKNPGIILTVAKRGAYGIGKGWGHSPTAWNACHYGIGVIKDFDLKPLPDALRKSVIQEWGITIMEEWGEVDVGEAARYGLEFMLRNDYAPREHLARLFGGDDKYASDSDMIDRTFCALRVWAVIRPDEMEFWINNTVDDAEIRKGLTWLLHNPWGKGESR